MSVSVIIPVCGDPIWDAHARAAAETAWKQTVKPNEVIIHRASNVAEARNQGSVMASSEWQIFLDADDELDPFYIEAMLGATGDIRRPITQGFYEDGTEEPRDELAMIPRMDLRSGNFIIIGAMHRREAFRKSGGFFNWPILEDWDLWQTMVKQGAEVVDVPLAVYRIGVHPGSRNTNPAHSQIYAQIRRKHSA